MEHFDNYNIHNRKLAARTQFIMPALDLHNRSAAGSELDLYTSYRSHPKYPWRDAVYDDVIANSCWQVPNAVALYNTQDLHNTPNSTQVHGIRVHLAQTNVPSSCVRKQI